MPDVPVTYQKKEGACMEGYSAGTRRCGKVRVCRPRALNPHQKFIAAWMCQHKATSVADARNKMILANRAWQAQKAGPAKRAPKAAKKAKKATGYSKSKARKAGAKKAAATRKAKQAAPKQAAPKMAKPDRPQYWRGNPNFRAPSIGMYN